MKGKKCCDEKISETKNFKEDARQTIQKEKRIDGFKSNTSMNGKQNQRHRDKHKRYNKQQKAGGHMC